MSQQFQTRTYEEISKVLEMASIFADQSARDLVAYETEVTEDMANQGLEMTALGIDMPTVVAGAANDREGDANLKRHDWMRCYYDTKATVMHKVMTVDAFTNEYPNITRSLVSTGHSQAVIEEIGPNIVYFQPLNFQ